MKRNEKLKERGGERKDRNMSSRRDVEKIRRGRQKERIRT